MSFDQICQEIQLALFKYQTTSILSCKTCFGPNLMLFVLAIAKIVPLNEGINEWDNGKNKVKPILLNKCINKMDKGINN